MASFLQDVAFSVRQLWRRPMFTLTAVLTLAIGMGVNAVAFTVVNGLLFKGTALRRTPGLGRIVVTPAGDEEGNTSLAEYERFADATRGTLDVAAEGRLSVAWRHDGTTETAWVLFVSSNYFSIVHVRPIAGRVDVARAIDGQPSVVIGERFWREKLNASSLAGLTLRLNEIDVSVAGVLPDSYTGPAGIYSPDVWLPLDDLTLFRTSPALQKRDTRWVFVLARLRPGAGVPEVQGRIDAAAAAMAHDWPDSHRGRGVRLRLFTERNSELRGLTTAASIAMGIIGLVLLLACFNVANLLLARGAERERDMAIRAAIGAGRARLMRLVLIEGFLIAALSGAAGVVLARWTQAFVGSFAIPIDQPQHIDLAPDATVVGFILLLVAVAGVVPGLWPALSAARVDVLGVLGSQGASAGASRSRLRQWLVGLQIAGSTAFLAIAALLAQTYGNLASADLGFAHDRLLVAEFAPASHGYDADRAERYARALVVRVRALPGTTDVALSTRAPFFIGFNRMTPVSRGDAPCEPGTPALSRVEGPALSGVEGPALSGVEGPALSGVEGPALSGVEGCQAYATLAIGPGYFRTIGVPMTEGREFQAGGTSGEAIVNQPLARVLWPDGGALGQTLRVGVRGAPATVIGVTAMTHPRGVNREQPTLYLPLGRDDFEGALAIVARTATPPEPLVRPVTDAAQALDPNVAMLSVKTMRERMAVQLWPFRTMTWLFSICGTLALVLATVGLAGVVSYAVNRRRREFGVRMSIGATRRDLVADVLKGSGRLLVPGLVAGILLSAGVARLLRFALYGVNVLDPLTYLAVAVIECVIVGVACIGPALRASRVDPLIALRAE